MYLSDRNTHVHQGRYQARMFIEALLEIAPNGGRAKCSSTKARHRNHELWWIHTTEYHTAIKKTNKQKTHKLLLTQSMIGKNLKIMMLSKKGQAPKNTYRMVPFQNFKNRTHQKSGQ